MNRQLPWPPQQQHQFHPHQPDQFVPRQAPSPTRGGHPGHNAFMNESQMAAELNTVQLVADLDPKKIQEVAASQFILIKRYYQDVHRDAQRLYRWALLVTGTGLPFFLVSVSLGILQQPTNGVAFSFLSGVVIEGIAVIQFWLYSRLQNQLERFHERLDRTQQCLLANSICEHLEGDLKASTQIEMIRTIMYALGQHEVKTRRNDAL
jgi:hypothetical protein